MSSDLHDRILDAAVASVRAGNPLADVLAEVVALAAAEAPSPAWEAIAAIDTAADMTKALPWFVRQFEERPAPDDLAGIWFGMYVVRGNSPGRTEAATALSGGPGFPDAGWLADHNWDAAGYVPAAGLRSLMPLAAAEEPDVRAIVAGPVVFAYTLALAAELVDGGGAAVLGERSQLGVVVGVPDAGTVVLGVLTPGGLDRSTAARVEPAEADAAPS
ncbi:MAG: hypothetical protein ACR2MO_08815 [Acidimicrobiales bacterium]